MPKPNPFDVPLDLDDPCSLLNAGKQPPISSTTSTITEQQATSLLDLIPDVPKTRRRAYTVYLSQDNIDRLEQEAARKGMKASRLLDDLLTKILK